METPFENHMCHVNMNGLANGKSQIIFRNHTRDLKWEIINGHGQ